MLEFVDFFIFFFFFPHCEGAVNATTMDVEVVDEEDSASAGRGEGGADGRAHARPSGGDGRAHARPSDAAASAARQASAGDITRMVLALGEAARAEQPRGDQTRGGA